MSLTPKEHLLIKTGLDQLYDQISSINGADHLQIRRFIDVGEHGFALDWLADLYMDLKVPPSSATLSLFQALATTMKMTPGDKWD